MFKIDPNRTYPHLTKAPIVEAVIEVRVNTEKPLEEEYLLSSVKKRVPGYSKISPQHEYKHELKLPPDKKSELKVADPVFKGARLHADGTPQIVQFNRDGFVFSRLQPYETWESLQKEAWHLWGTYKELACPLMINRVGVRFINEFPISFESFDLDDYLQGAPKPPGDSGLPFLGFFHQDALDVPNSPYKINLIRTIQKSLQPKGFQLIIDIDVFNDNNFETNDDILLENLAEMRCLKNQLFFDCITEKTLEMLR